MRRIFCFLFFGYVPLLFGQKVVEEIAESYFQYYKYPQEQFIYQFNKANYFPGEEAYFQLYVLDKREKKLFFDTKKVCFLLFNDKGQRILKKYLSVDEGVAANSITIPKNYQGSVLYYSFESNWNLNFQRTKPKPIFVNVEESELKEDIDVLAHFKVYPEANILIDSLTSMVFVRAADKNFTGLAIEGVIKDEQDEDVAFFKTDDSGFGRFFLKPKFGKSYRAEVILGAKKFSQNLPSVSKNGLVFNVFDRGREFYFGFRANLKTTERLSYIIHSDGKIALAGILNLDDKRKNAFYFLKDKLLKGINTLSIFSGKELIGERSFFNNFKKSYREIEVTQKRIHKDSVEFAFQKKLTDSIVQLSVSILPKSNNAVAKHRLFRQIYLDPIDSVLHQVKKEYVLDPITLKQFFDLQKFSNQWGKILASDTTKIKHYFKRGFDVSGTLYNRKKKEPLRNTVVNFFTSYQAGSFTTDDKGEFSLKELYYASDDELKMDPQTIRKVIPSFKLEPHKDLYDTLIEVNLKKTFIGQNLVSRDVNPFFTEDYEQLGGIEIKSKTRSKKDPDVNPLDDTSFTQNYEVNEENVYNYRTVLQYLEYQSSIVVDNRSSFVSIYNTRTNSQTIIGGGDGVQPMNIYIDQILMRQQDAEMLKNIYMHEVKSIRINKSGIGSGGLNPFGSIHIYLNKKGLFKELKSRSKRDAEVLYIRLPYGFEKPKIYSQPEYQYEIGSESFNRYATLHWEPLLKLTNEKMTFKANIPEQIKAYKLIIQGLTNEGKIIDFELEFVN